MQIKFVPFKKLSYCRLQLQYAVWFFFFCKIYNFVRQHYVDL